MFMDVYKSVSVQISDDLCLHAAQAGIRRKSHDCALHEKMQRQYQHIMCHQVAMMYMRACV